jgi:hypothetical protein
MITNTIKTPFGTFTRKSKTAYSFAAVAEAATSPELGLRVVGNRAGDPGLTREAYPGAGYKSPAVRYHIVWSRTAAGARKNAEGYCWAPARCVGVFNVEVR